MESQSYRAILKKVPRRLERKRLLIHFVFDVGLWTAMILLVNDWPGGLVGQGFAAVLFPVFSFRSFGLMHDCVHAAGDRNGRMNHSLGWVYGVFCFLPYPGWRDMHIEHHMWTGNVERDPTTAILLQFERSGYRISKFVGWCWRSWLPILGFMQHVVFWRRSLSKRDYRFAIMTIAYFAICFACLGPLTVAAGLICYLCLVEVINLPHHLGFYHHHGEARFPASEQYRFARSCLYPKWFAHFVLLNFNLHAEHHLFPAHPWYQLDNLHAEVEAAAVPLTTCQANEWILNNRTQPIEEILIRTFRKDSGDGAA